METYRIQFDNQVIRYDKIDPEAHGSFLVTIQTENGYLKYGQLKYKDYKYYFSDNQLSVINNRLKYSQTGDNLVDIFNNYCQQNQYTKSVGNYLSEFCAYLLFFNFAASNCFYKLLPISTPLPLESFSSLLNRSNISLLNFVCNTFRKISPNNSFLCYTTAIINFLAKFDNIFYVGPQLEFYDISSFCISVMLEINNLLTSKVCKIGSRFLARTLSSVDSQPEPESSSSRDELIQDKLIQETEELFHHFTTENDEYHDLPPEYGAWLQFGD